MVVTPDSTNRIVLTREMRDALNLKPGQPLDVSITGGAIFLTPAANRDGKLIRKGRLKIYTGEIPDVDVDEAVRKSRGSSGL